MTYNHLKVNALIARLGRTATIYKREQDGQNEFNNSEWAFTDDPDEDGEPLTALCLRSYDNRNSEVQHNGGDRHRDNPVFFFPLSAWKDTVDPNDRVGYPEPLGGETIYELQAPTFYDTHVEIFGELVNHN